MKIIILYYLLISSIISATAQRTSITDSLKTLLSSSTADTSRVMLLKTLGQYYHRANPDTAMRLAEEGLLLAQNLKFQKGEAECLLTQGVILEQEGRYPQSLNVLLQALVISERMYDQILYSRILRSIGKLYASQGEYEKALNNLFRSRSIQEQLHSEGSLATTLKVIGEVYLEKNQLDSASAFLHQSYQMLENKNDVATDDVLKDLGQVQAKLGNHAKAIVHFKNALPYSIADNDKTIQNDAYLGIARLFMKRKQTDSCIFYSLKGLEAAQKINYFKGVLAASQLLAEVYEPINEHKAFHYYKISTLVKDSVFNVEKVKQVQNLGFVEQQRLQSIQANRLKYQNQIKLYALLVTLSVFLLIALILWRANVQKQKARNKIEKAYEELKAAQAQLIQSEKMASLGELTAGIAHEIQNPLNFVNNFSEVNVEMLQELKAERLRQNGERNEKAENEIIDDVIENEQKIALHGKRADAIVKGMLQHSRTSTGKKEPTDINALADEYLRLSYHGYRAKDKDFNATLQTDFDANSGKISIVPQEIGRVLLNLFNNAFYAASLPSKGGFKDRFGKHEPTVWVTTSKIPPSGGRGAGISISVKDNGPGIPEKLLDKIFQPFFTTKPTGQGTGLGLSLSYDIIKAHGGELKVETKEGEGTAFKIVLPLNGRKDFLEPGNETYM